MAGRGFAPSGQRSRERDNAQTVKLVGDGKTRGPALPRNALKDRQGHAIAWHPMTVKWWNHWRRSPQAVRMMTAPDWDFLLDTALMHHNMWTKGSFELAGEVRLRVQKFGATPEDRARLKVEIAVGLEETSAPASSANVTSIDDRRMRIAMGEDD